MALAIVAAQTFDENRRLRIDNVEREQRDHTERLLKEIIDWAKDLCTLLSTSWDYPPSKVGDLLLNIDNLMADYYGLVRIAETIDKSLADAILLKHKKEPEGILYEDGVEVKHNLLNSYHFDLVMNLGDIGNAPTKSTLGQLWRTEKCGIDLDLQTELKEGLVKIIKVAFVQRAKLLKI